MTSSLDKTTASDYRTRDHRYAYDLDLFGPGSVFERLNATHTPLGGDRLAHWLLGSRRVADQVERQAAVRELIGREAERTELEVALRRLMDQPGLDPSVLAQQTRGVIGWGLGPSPAPPSALQRVLAYLLPAVSLAGIAAWIGLGWPWWVAGLPYGFNVVYAGRVKDLGDLMRVFEGVARTLAPWGDSVERAARFQFDSPVLRDSIGRLSEEQAPSAIRQLGRLAYRLSQRRNAYWALTGNIVLLSDVRARHGLSDWHAEHGAQLSQWLEALGELEAWASLATWAESLAEPAWPVVDASGPWLQAEELAHPLLPAEGRVGNNAQLQARGALWVVTGSNMSGKSTFLRALGLGVLFADLGLPVPGRALTAATACVGHQHEGRGITPPRLVAFSCRGAPAPPMSRLGGRGARPWCYWTRSWAAPIRRSAESEPRRSFRNSVEWTRSRSCPPTTSDSQT